MVCSRHITTTQKVRWFVQGSSTDAKPRAGQDAATTRMMRGKYTTQTAYTLQYDNVPSSNAWLLAAECCMTAVQHSRRAKQTATSRWTFPPAVRYLLSHEAAQTKAGSARGKSDNRERLANDNSLENGRTQPARRILISHYACTALSSHAPCCFTGVLVRL